MSRVMTVINGPKSRARAHNWVAKAPNGTVVELREDRRSLEQNKKMWPLLAEISLQLTHCNGRKYDPNRWKVIFLHAWGQEVEFLPSLDGDTFIPSGGSSSKLTKAEMSEFIEFILAEGTKRGVKFADDPVAA